MKTTKRILILFLITFLFACSSSVDNELHDPILKKLSAQKPNWTESNYGFSGPIAMSRVKVLTEELQKVLPKQYMQANWWSLSGPVFYQDFGTFRNYFYYLDPKSKDYFKADPIITKVYKIAYGAQSRDKSGRILAEARLLEITGEGKTIASDAYIEEFHYGKRGEVVFYCKSLFRRQDKIKEMEKIGVKTKEFYITYPALADISSVTSGSGY